MAESERIAYRNDEVAHLDDVRVTDRDGRETFRVHLQDSDVGQCIGADDGSVERVLVEQ